MAPINNDALCVRITRNSIHPLGAMLSMKLDDDVIEAGTSVGQGTCLIETADGTRYVCNVIKGKLTEPVRARQILDISDTLLREEEAAQAKRGEDFQEAVIDAEFVDLVLTQAGGPADCEPETQPEIESQNPRRATEIRIPDGALNMAMNVVMGVVASIFGNLALNHFNADAPAFDVVICAIIALAAMGVALAFFPISAKKEVSA